MAEPKKVDLVIIGGGCAGLSLGSHLAKEPVVERTLILEPRETYMNDRTWSFWAPPKHPLDHLVSKTWDRWSYGQLGSEARAHRTPQSPYQSIQSIDFYESTTAAIAASDQVDLALGEGVNAVSRRGNGWLVKTSQRDIEASNVIDTRPPSEHQLAHTKMFQCFVGQRLKKVSAFRADLAELMTDMVADDDGFLFSYVLPLSPDEALVEATRFSNKPMPWRVLSADLDAIKSRRGWLDASVIDEEKGRLPMGLLPQSSPDLSLVYAGTTAGGLRAASGYGFMRIQHWAKCCHEALQETKQPVGHPPEPSFQAWMDTLFLDVLLQEPACTPKLFNSLYDNAPVDALIRFMSDQSSLADKLNIIRSLPPGPFLRTMFKR